MIGTSAGTKIAVCASPTSANTQAALSGLTYIDVGWVEGIGDVGPTRTDVEFDALEDVGLHLSGPLDNGAISIVCARDPLNAGQIALRTAAATKFEYAIRITEPDGTITWVRGPVMSARKMIGGDADITKRTFVVGLNAYFELAPSQGVPANAFADDLTDNAVFVDDLGDGSFLIDDLAA